MNDVTVTNIILLLIGFIISTTFTCYISRHHIPGLFQVIGRCCSSPMVAFRHFRQFMQRKPAEMHTEVEMSVRRVMTEVFSPSERGRRLTFVAEGIEDNDLHSISISTESPLHILQEPSLNMATATVASLSIGVLASKSLNAVLKNWAGKAVKDVHTLFSIGTDLRDECQSVLQKAGVTDAQTLVTVIQTALESLTTDFISRIDPFLSDSEKRWISSSTAFVMKEVIQLETKVVDTLPSGVFGCLKSGNTTTQLVASTPNSTLQYTPACSSPDAAPATDGITITVPASPMFQSVAGTVSSASPTISVPPILVSKLN